MFPPRTSYVNFEAPLWLLSLNLAMSSPQSTSARSPSSRDTRPPNRGDPVYTLVALACVDRHKSTVFVRTIAITVCLSWCLRRSAESGEKLCILFLQSVWRLEWKMPCEVEGPISTN